MIKKNLRIQYVTWSDIFIFQHLFQHLMKPLMLDFWVLGCVEKARLLNGKHTYLQLLVLAWLQTSEHHYWGWELILRKVTIGNIHMIVWEKHSRWGLYSHRRKSSSVRLELPKEFITQKIQMMAKQREAALLSMLSFSFCIQCSASRKLILKGVQNRSNYTELQLMLDAFKHFSEFL